MTIPDFGTPGQTDLMDNEDNDSDQIVGGPFDGAGVIVGKELGNVSWWGWSEIHRWRWNHTHIDLGPLSVYELKRLWLWRTVAFVIKPLRMWYHWRYCSTSRQVFVDDGDG